jgi:hypothetical protein
MGRIMGRKDKRAGEARLYWVSGGEGVRFRLFQHVPLKSTKPNNDAGFDQVRVPDCSIEFHQNPAYNHGQ